jgi:SAM-dependent methyltransferase
MDGMSIYQCVLCNGPVAEDDSRTLICAVCGACYPTVEDIRILVLNPEAFLLTHASQVMSRSQELQARRELLARFAGEAISDEAMSRLKRDFEARQATQELVKESFEPVAQSLEHQRPVSFLERLSSYHTGWPFSQMTPYLYKDWYGTREAGFVNKLFTNAIEDYCGAQSPAVAVLGCGACGLLYEVSRFFSHAYGLDLSLLTLLLARRLLRGEEVSLHLSLPDDSFPKVQRQVRLKGPELRRDNITLLAANITNLPFAPSSLSCVITQYLMNITTDQQLLAEEINRVLAPGGVWINFSTPGSMTYSDLTTHLDPAHFFNRKGFDVLDVSMRRCHLLDFSDVSDWTVTVEHSNMFFAVRKARDLASAEAAPFADYFSGRSDSILSTAPKLTDRFSISVSHRRRFSSSGTSDSQVLEVGAYDGNVLLKGNLLPEVTRFLSQFLQMLDGTLAVSHIIKALKAEFPDLASEREVIRFLNSLQDMGVLRCLQINQPEP